MERWPCSSSTFGFTWWISKRMRHARARKVCSRTYLAKPGSISEASRCFISSAAPSVHVTLLDTETGAGCQGSTGILTWCLLVRPQAITSSRRIGKAFCLGRAKWGANWTVSYPRAAIALVGPPGMIEPCRGWNRQSAISYSLNTFWLDGSAEKTGLSHSPPMEASDARPLHLLPSPVVGYMRTAAWPPFAALSSTNGN